MALTPVTINGRSYDIACDDGQEQHLIELARMVDARVRDLVSAIGQVGDARLLVMTSLILADELSDLRDELTMARAGGAEPQAADLSAPAAEAGLRRLAGRIDALAARLSSA